MAIGVVILALGTILSVLAYLASRGIVRRERKRSHIRVTRIGFCYGVGQALAMFSIVGWGFFHPGTSLGRVVAASFGVPAIISLVCAICVPISSLLQRRGILLFYRVPGED